MFYSIKESVETIEELKAQILEIENQINHTLKEAIDEHLRKGESYYCIEENKNFYPCWNFYDDPLHPEILRCNGVSICNGAILVECFAAKKDGTRSSIGSKKIDITKLIY